VSDLSDKLAQATLVDEEPVHVAWKEKRPLIRKMRVSEAEWLVLAAYPWQEETDAKNVTVTCGAAAVTLSIRGKHTEIYRVVKGLAQRVEMSR
jgi:hypothetical protein